jgi:hypothetical protein
MIVCPMLVAWGKLTEPIAVFDKTVRCQNRHVDPFASPSGGTLLLRRMMSSFSLALALTVQVICSAAKRTPHHFRPG